MPAVTFSPLFHRYFAFDEERAYCPCVSDRRHLFFFRRMRKRLVNVLDCKSF